MKNLPKTTAGNLHQILLPVLGISILSACNTNTRVKIINTIADQSAISIESAPHVADATTILGRPEVPVLCYHQLRDFRPSDSKISRDYIVPATVFRDQIKSLADSGYHTILPDQLYDWLAFGKPMPSKPVMISFDDTNLEQYTIALPELNKYGFKGVFFIMTVSLGRPGYMKWEQVKHLADEGHVIGSHTWNHENVKTYSEDDWAIQVDKPARKLREITGRPVDYFAYPFGIWDKEAIVKLKQHGIKSAFQLSSHRDESDPLFSIRRIIVPGEWSAARMQKYMKHSF